MFLLDDVFAFLSPSKSMFANVNFCNIPRDAGYWMRSVGTPIVPIIPTVLIKNRLRTTMPPLEKILLSLRCRPT